MHLFKFNAFQNFGSSMHSVVEKWPIEFGCIVESRYVLYD